MMNANRRAAAEQDRKTYREVTAQLGLLGLDPAIPEGVRDLAEKTVAQTREARDRSTDAFDASVAAFEKSLEAAGKGAAAFTHKIVDTARRDVNSSFDLATSLAGAKGLYDMVKLRAVSWRKQVDALTAQAEEVRALSVEPAAAAPAPTTGASISVTHHSIALEPDGPGSYRFKFATERGEISGRVRVALEGPPDKRSDADQEQAALNQILALSREFAQSCGD